MGYYVNPKEKTKEEFLKEHGIEVPLDFRWEDLPSGMLPVILVDNIMFTAAGIAFDEFEFKAFMHPQDTRSKRIFLVETEKLLEFLR